MRDHSGIYQQYLGEIASYRQLSPAREVELSSIIMRRADLRAVERAVTELVNANLRLVVHCLGEFATFVDSPSCPLTRMDLVGEGNIGLLRAARTFDAHHAHAGQNHTDGSSVRFSTYACTCIRSHMLRALKRARLVHVPDQHFVYWKRIRQLEAKHGEGISDEILLKELGVSRTGLERLRRSLHSSTLRLEDMCPEDNRSDWADLLPNGRAEAPDEEVSRRDLRRLLQRELRLLPPRTRRILAAVFLRPEGATLSDLARTFGFSRERARQICQRGLVLLRQHMTTALSPEERSALLAPAHA